jgi:hypothetical protein
MIRCSPAAMFTAYKPSKGYDEYSVAAPNRVKHSNP